MIDRRSFFDQTINNDIKTYESIITIAKYNRDDYTMECSLIYPYVKKKYKMVAIYLSKQLTLDADPKAIRQINLIGNLE